MRTNVLKVFGAMAVAGALVGTGAVASAAHTPTCTVTFTAPSPFSPVATGTPINYAGSVSISGNADYTIREVAVDVQGAGDSPPVTVEDLRGLSAQGPGPVTLKPFTVTWPGTGKAQVEAHVYMSYGGDGATTTTHCHADLVVNTGTNQLPEVPWSAGLPLLLGAGAFIALRRRGANAS